MQSLQAICHICVQRYHSIVVLNVKCQLQRDCKCGIWPSDACKKNELVDQYSIN